MTAVRPASALALIALAPLVLASASAAQEAVRVEGHAADRALLEGTWTGGYACEATGRHGTLTFSLGPGAARAVARLEMVPRATPEAPDPAPIVLALHIVEVEASGDGLAVRGALAPYDDPEWRLGLETHFTGTLRRNRIEGAFTSLPTSVDTIPASGRWWATRQPRPEGAADL